MRKIKFRAWDNEEKCWFPKDNRQEWINITHMGDIVYGDFDGDPEDGNGRFEIKMFTGLHDKRGKEIYEGDILSPHQVVEWINESGGWFLITKEKRLPLCQFTCSYVAVIGNIYESPELLEAK